MANKSVVIKRLGYAQSLNHVQFFAIPWTVVPLAPLSMGFSRQEYWSGFPWPSPGDLPNPGSEPMSLSSLSLAGKFFSTSTTGEALKECERVLYRAMINLSCFPISILTLYSCVVFHSSRLFHMNDCGRQFTAHQHPFSPHPDLDPVATAQPRAWSKTGPSWWLSTLAALHNPLGSF